MTEREIKRLLRDREVVEEINRHLWLESEKAGYNIGFEKAAEDWIKRFSSAWIKHHSAKSKGKLRKTAQSKSPKTVRRTISARK